MEFEKLLELIEKYARSYIRYSAAIFAPTVPDQKSYDPSLRDGKILIFAFISATLGVLFHSTLAQGGKIIAPDYVRIITTELIFWISISLILHFIINIGIKNHPVKFEGSLAIVLGVIPIVYAMCAFFQYASATVSRLWLYEECTPWFGYFTAIALQIALVTVCMPIALSGVRTVSLARRVLAVAVTVLIIISAQAMTFLSSVTRDDGKHTPPMQKMDQTRNFLYNCFMKVIAAFVLGTLAATLPISSTAYAKGQDCDSLGRNPPLWSVLRCMFSGGSHANPPRSAPGQPISAPASTPASEPTPVPVPPPVPPEAKEFVVYFPWDQYILTPEAQTVVQAASGYATSNHAARVVVVGHTDTSGSAAYNVRLSERRAKVVADAMIAGGVPGSVLQVDWKGEVDLAVPTPDGVKEPLNRRTTIDINF